MREHCFPILDAFGLLALGRSGLDDLPPQDERDTRQRRRVARPKGWSETRQRMRIDVHGRTAT